MRKVDKELSVWVVEDDRSVLKSLCALLTTHGYRTQGFESAEAFLEAYDPDLRACILLDLRLPGMSGLELQAHLGARGSSPPIIVLTAHGDIPVAVRSMKAGAIDFIEKPAPIDHLLESIRLAGDVLANRPVREVPKQIVHERLAKLTEREREVLEHLILGRLNKEIAGELGISQRTVEVHRSRIREKMQARGISDLIRMMQ